MSRKTVGLWALVGFLALLGVGTINNQLRINKANARLADQAENGQKALTRQCSLFPVSKKLYADMLERRVITAEDYDLVVSTATTACRP
jgi:hypothetical protein